MPRLCDYVVNIDLIFTQNLLLKIFLDEEEESSETSKEVDETVSFPQLINQLKRDVFPILFLMMGSIFFLFGTVLYLFSSNGTLTLQWQGDHAPYFLFFALPLVGLGAWFYETLDSDE